MARTTAMAAAILLGLSATVLATSSNAQTVLRISEGGTANIDPQLASIVSDAILMYNVYDTLVFPAVDQGTAEIRPHLAESVELDASGTVYTIKLKPNVKFHSGNVLSAEDVVFSLNRMLALKKGFSYLFDGWIKSAEARDPLTAVITLNKPYSTFYSSLTRLSILDSKAVMANKRPGDYGEFGDYGTAWLNENSAGTGAYRPTFHKQTERTELRKFPDYFKGVPAKAPDVVRLNYHFSDPTVVTLFQRGELDLVRSFIPAETKRALLDVKGVTLAEEPGIAMFFIKVNNKKPPFDDVHCRRAFAYAVDYDNLLEVERIDAKTVGAVPARGPLLSSMSGYVPSMPVMKRDMKRAREELAQCRHKPGSVKIQITWIDIVSKEEPIALLLQQNWKELGFTSEIQRLPWPVYVQMTAKPDTAPMVGQVYTFARTPDPDAYLYNLYHSSRHGQFSAAEYFADAEVDALLDKGRATPVGPERTAIYEQVFRRIVDLQPSIFGYEAINHYAKRDVVSIPTMARPELNTGLMGGNHLFRLMEMKGAN